MRKFSFTFVVSIICILVLGYSEYTYSGTSDEITGPKILGIQLGMNINEVNKILDKEGYGLYTVTITDSKRKLNVDEDISSLEKDIVYEIRNDKSNSFVGSLKIDDNWNLISMSFNYRFFNTNDCRTQSFVIKFCENYHIPLTQSNVEIIPDDYITSTIDESGLLVTDMKDGYKVSFTEGHVEIEKDNVVFK